ncbi:MAG: hypothetical protein EU532_04320 [Promethearchaeota archaeon]|nr:MAG: hypothetical protein EU532_04320 [Candidatus Lokiarchaeota archaeon]
MLFQEISFCQGFLALLFTTILVLFIKFLLGTLITRWWAIKYGWNDSYKSSIHLNSFWLIIDLFFSIIFIFVVNGIFLAVICAFVTNILIGTLIASRIYEQKYKKSLIFISFIFIVLLLFYFIIYLILIVIFSIILLAI